MATATVSPIVALLLALSMLFSPAAYTTPSDVPEMTVTVTRADGESISGGLVKTTDGIPALILNVLQESLMITGDASYYSDGTVTYTVSANELMKLAGEAVQTLPEPTENDVNAIMLFVQGVAGGVSADALSIAPMGEGMSFAIDLDQLCKDLNTAVPNTLTTYAAFLNPTLAKYSQALAGEVITCEQLAAAWPELGLDQVNTGLKGNLSVVPGRDSLSIVGSLCDVSFVAKVTETGFSCSITSPDGKEYVLDTADLLVLAEVLSEVPSVMTDAGFSVTEDGDTTTIKVDLAALSTDLNRSLTLAVALHSTEIDELLNKYRTWFELIDEDFAAQLTAANLAKAFQQGAISLPPYKGELTIEQDYETRTYNINGYFGNTTLSGKYHSREDVGSFLLAFNDSYEPLYLTLDIATDYSTTSYSLSSSMPVLGLFNTVTLYIDDSYDAQYTLTTDTNVLRLSYSDDEQYMEAKIGPVNLSYKMDEADVNHFELYMMDFFARLLVAENHFALDTSVFGLDAALNNGGFSINGYVYEDFDPDYVRHDFGVHYNEDTMLSAYLAADGRNESCYAMTVTTQYASVSFEGDTYTLTPYYGAEGEAYVIALNGDPVYSVSGEVSEDGSATTMYFYTGLDMTVTPVFTVVLDNAPDKVAVPAGATPVDPETFAGLVEDFLD